MNRPLEPDPVDVHVGRRLRDIRLSRGLRQVDLADRMGITQQAVSKFEDAINSLLAPRLYHASKTLGVGVGELFEGIDE